jgi:hypothetical protein
MYLIHLLDYSPHRGYDNVVALFFWRWTLSESFLDLAKSKRWVIFLNVRLVFIEALCQAFEKDENDNGPQEQGTAGFHDGAS